MKAKKIAFAAATLAAGLSLFGLAACSSGGSSQVAATKPAPSVQIVQLDILGSGASAKFGITGPDGNGHDTYAPSEFTAIAGKSYTIRVYNYDEGPHSFTIDALKINQTIAPYVSATQPSLTTFTIKFPKVGLYRWYCKFPCDAKHGSWAMKADRNGNGPSQDGFMAGYVNVIAG